MPSANDALESFLRQMGSEPRAKVYSAGLSPESLQTMGKEAAAKLLKDETPLNDSIVKMASAHPNITPEQVKRIVEFANESVYLAKHAQAKQAGAESSYPRFDLADPARILQELGDGSKPTTPNIAGPDFSSAPPKREKVASAKADALLADAFGIGKTDPELDFTKESAVNDVISAKQNLTSLKEHLEHAGEQIDMAEKTAQADYYLQVRNHILEGGALADVMVAARSTGTSNEKIASVMRPIVERLITEKVASVERLKSGIKEMDKVAHRVVNPEHPLVKTFGAIIEAQNEIEKIASGLQDVDDELKNVDSFIKEKFSGSAR